MYLLTRTAVVILLVSAVFAQSPEPPLSDTRLSIHTLVREDIFAGFLVNDLERFSRGERNIQALLETRASARPDLLAWQGGATLYRAVLAHEANRRDEYQEKYKQARALFAEARQISPRNGGAAAVTGGSLVVFADRLPEADRAAAWQEAWDAYQILWKQQGQMVERMPVHMRGELLGGLAQSAQRTGRNEELGQFLDRIITLLPDTPYEPMAKRWKEKPDVAAKTSVTCLTCHESGRLSARLASFSK